MTKYSLSAASLITAIPAAYLAYLLVMTFLKEPGFNELAGFFQIIAGLTLGLVTLMVLMPLGILIFGKKPPKAPERKKEADDVAEEDEDLAVDDEADDAFADDADEFEDDGFGDEEFEDDGFEDEDEFK